MIRIGIDARLASMPGVGRYVECVLRGLDSIKPRDLDILAYVDRSTADAVAVWGLRSVRLNEITVPPASVREQFFWRSQLRHDLVDVFHAPHFVFPVFAGVPVVVTLHDLVYYRFPPAGIDRWPMLAYYRAMHRLAASKARAIVTDSQFSAQELRSVLGIGSERLHVIPIALGPDFDAVAMAPGSPKRSRYLLYVGTNKPWKNLRMLLDALRLAQQAQGDIHLIIAGKRGRNEEDVARAVSATGVSTSVTVLGAVSTSELRALYRDAEAVVCPSLYEGFGLTPLEAMACGAPVIASNAASLPEVVGSAAVTLPPDDKHAWAQAMIDLWTDRTKRHALIARGRERASRFGLEQFAEKTASVYREAAS